MKSSSLHVDYFMFFAALFLVMLGLLMVTSASMTVSAMQFGSAYQGEPLLPLSQLLTSHFLGHP